jgi:hypothetical protein
LAVRQLKRYASWVQTVREWNRKIQFPYRLNPFEISVVRIRKSASECLFVEIKQEKKPTTTRRSAAGMQYDTIN